MNRQNYYDEANEYSSYEGEENYENVPYDANEAGYFAQGGLESCLANVVEPLDRTYTFQLANYNLVPATAVLFAANTPLTVVEPAGVEVIVQETGGFFGDAGVSHETVRNDVKGNPVVLQGCRYFLGASTVQLGNAWTIIKRFTTGKLIQYLWQPANYV